MTTPSLIFYHLQTLHLEHTYSHDMGLVNLRPRRFRPFGVQVPLVVYGLLLIKERRLIILSGFIPRLHKYLPHLYDEE